MIGVSGTDSAIVADQPALRGLVVIRRDEQQGIHADLRGFPAHFDGTLRAVRTGAGNDGNAPGDRFHTAPYDIHMFRDIQCGRLAGRAADDDGICPFGDLPLQDLVEFLREEGTVLVHRRDDRHTGTSENCHDKTSLSIQEKRSERALHISAVCYGSMLEALHLAMTVMDLFAPCPRKCSLPAAPFGVFPFLLLSSVCRYIPQNTDETRDLYPVIGKL